MKLRSLLPALALLLPFSSLAEESLFNGKNLDQWRIDSKSKATHWTVKDGTIHCQSDPKKAGSLLWTTREFTDFTLTLEFKNGEGTIDSGVMLKRAKDQIQIGISGSLKRDLTASPYIPGKGYPVEGKEAIAAVPNCLSDGELRSPSSRTPGRTTYLSAATSVVFYIVR